MGNRNSNKPVTVKTTYKSPALVNYGKLARLTRTKHGNVSDNGNNRNSQAPISG